MSSFLVVCAMPHELKGLCRVLKNVTKVTSSFYRTPTASGGELLLVASGIGPISAACAVMEMGHLYTLSGVVLLGVGGALSADLDIGDLVVAKQIVQHDSCAIFDEGRFLVRPGSYLSSAKAAEHHDEVLYTDPALSNMCHTAITKGRVVQGSIVTGAEFSGTTERKSRLAELVENAVLVEMEAAGIALAAEKLNIPYTVAKGVSDRLIPETADTTIMDEYRTCFDRAMVGPSAIAQYLQNQL